MTRNENNHRRKLPLGTHDISPLDSAIEAWRAAWHRLDDAPDSETIYRYNFAILQLEAAFWRDRAGASESVAFETFRLRLIEQEQD